MTMKNPTSTNARGTIAAATALALAAAATLAQPVPGVTFLENPPGVDTRILAVANEGRFVAGEGQVRPDNRRTGAFIISREGGRVDFPPGTVAFNSSAGDISADGSYAAGATTAELEAITTTAALFGRDGSFLSLGYLPGDDSSSAQGISGDGRVVVGHSSDGRFENENRRAFRWTPETGMTDLGHLRADGVYTTPYDVSTDGRFMVGESISGALFGGSVEAFIWSADSGFQGLAALAGTLDSTGTATAVAADGRRVTGRSRYPEGDFGPVLWTDGVPVALGFIPGAAAGGATHISDRGDIVMGSMSGAGILDSTFLWTEATGSMLAREFLEMNGVFLPEGRFILSAMAPDGMSFSGESVAGSFIAVIPCPAAAPFLFLLIAAKRRR